MRQLLARFRAAVQRWLGFATTEQMFAYVSMLEAQNKKLSRDVQMQAENIDLAAAKRNQALLAELEAISKYVLTGNAEINKRLTATHIDHPANFSAPDLDWDTVQAMALRNLEKNPEEPNGTKV